MILIGFSNKYYTLWSYSEEALYSTLGNSSYQYGVKQIYSYIKNISFDLEKVKELYPDVTIDDELRGKSESWSKESKFVYPDEYFNFGKYEGTLISECTNQSYLMWFFNESCDNRHNIIKNRLIELGCAFYDDLLFSSVELRDEYSSKINLKFENEKIAEETYEKYKNPGVYSYEFSKSLTDDGKYFDEFLVFKFENYIEQYYNCYCYALPSIKGKAKRIKNKTLEMCVVTEINDETGFKCLKVTDIISIK